MRAGPLANGKVISLLNRYFVPVYAINDDYRANVVPAAEKDEYVRIFREAGKAKLSTGTVHVYILAPDGHPIDSQHVATSSKVEKLLDMLERTTKKLKTAEGKPLVDPAPQSKCPNCNAGSLVLHLTSRYLFRVGDDWVPLGDKARLGETRNASWAALPSENWIVLSPAESARLVAGNASREGASWEIEKQVAEKMLTSFYPQTENNDVEKNQIEQQTLKARVLSVKEGVAHVRIDGSLRMKHSFYHRDDDNVVRATVVGLLDYDLARKKIRSFQMVTDKATYGRFTFGVAVRSVP